MKNLLALAFAFFALSASAAATVEVAQQQSVDLVRQQFVSYYTAANADRSSSRMTDALNGLEAQTREITAAGFLRDDGSWVDIDYAQTPSGDWAPWNHSRRLIVMAKAYQTPGQSFYRNPRLLTQLNAALAYTKVFYGANKLP